MTLPNVIYKQIKVALTCSMLLLIFNFSTCKYSFKDTSPIPVEITNFRVNYFENKAQYVNTQLAPQISEKLKQKIINTTRLRQTNADDADYDISGYVSQYYTSTISISGASTSGNRLNVAFHLIFKNNKDDTKNFEADLTRSFDYSASKSLSEEESTLTPDIVKNFADEIFNKIFSNW
jgi:hypothetical protein